MNLQHPEALYFILPVIVLLLALALYARSKRRRAAAAFADDAMAARILPREDAGRFWAKLILLELAAVFSLLALARPQWGDVVEEVKVKGSDLYVLIDVSRSMLARDVAPSRLERAKLDVSNLLNRLKGERVGLIAFAGRAAVKCPLTSDYAFLRVALNELGPQSVDRGGTALGDAIRVALNVLPKAPDRDQALLLITDGDDQESEPMSAAAQAAERHVTIFTVGLGDPNEGARVPDKEGVNMRYDGKDVVSKMDDELLRKIALETNGAYVPARTSAYDLGKLYEEKLSLLRGEYAKEQKRRRMSERFEIPLLLAVLCFILELSIRPYQPERKVATETEPASKPKNQNQNQKKGGATPVDNTKNAAGALGMALLAILLFGGPKAFAADGHGLAGEAFKLFDKKEFKAAGEKFNEAEKGFEHDQRDDAMRAAFNAGNAFHRAGEFEKAREAYMKAALAPGKALAADAQFNLGTLASDEAKKLAGEKPEEVAPEKRAELIEKLKVAVAHFRSAMDLQAEYPGARSNIELIRQWLKLYANKWHELDRIKRRESMNLLQYLDELAKMQRALRLTTKALDESAGADEFAELKRAQDELFEEIDPLKEKIQKEIGGAGAQPNPQPGAQPGAGAVDPKQLEAAVKKLHEWADEAAGKMRGASSKLLGGDRDEAMTQQKDAVAPLERSWEALAPFGVTLQRDYDEQSKIVATLDPNEAENAEKKEESKDSTSKTASKDEKKEEPKEKPKEKIEPPTFTKEQLEELAEFQADVLRRTDALKFKAEKELVEVEKNSPAKTEGAEKEKEPKKEKEWLTLEDVQREEAAKKRAEAEKAKGAKPADPKKEDEDAPPDPEAIKKGLKLAIELAPKAAEKMNAALGHLKKQESAAALPDTLEARRILKEILDAQPKQKNKNQDDKKDQQNKDQNQDKDKQDQKDKKDQKDKDQQKKDEEKKKEEEQKKKDQDKKKDEKQEQEKQQSAKAEMSKEKAEEMLRKVRERELQRRKQKADDKEAIYGRMQGVEKDW